MLPADERDTGLALERTALAWRRTSYAQVVTGLVLIRLADTLAARVAIGVLLLAAAAMAGVAPQRHGRWRLGVVTAATVGVALVGAAEVL